MYTGAKRGSEQECPKDAQPEEELRDSPQQISWLLKHPYSMVVLLCSRIYSWR